MSSNSIKSFKGGHFFLSNFYRRPVQYRGLLFGSTEAAYQAEKPISEVLRQEFISLSPSESKKLGRKVTLRSDWEEIKDQVMEDILRCKFSQHEDLKQRLLATGEAYLIEGNDWEDTYWGVCKGVGLNKLGKLLMKIRKEFKEEI